MKVYIATLIFSVLSVNAFGSEYPSDATIGTVCQSQGPVQVCRALQHSGYAVLEIKYQGELASVKPSLWISVNYAGGSRQLSIPMDSFSGTAYVRVTGGCLVGVLGGCKVWGTDDMKNLLYWAQYQNHLNQLDLQVAFFSDEKWDNNGGIGKNYRFQFPDANP